MYHPDFLYDYHSQYFEEPQDSHKSDLEILMEDFNATLTYSHPGYLYNYQSQHFEEPQESYNFDFETLMEDFDATLTHSRLEPMIEHFVEIQNIQIETLRQLNNVVESLETSSKALETQISLLAQTPLGPFPEKHANIVTIYSEGQIENPKESDEVEESNNVVEESFGEQRVEIEKNPPTPPEREVVEEVEKEAPYVVPSPYNPPIPFSQRPVEAKIDSQSKTYVEVLENIYTNAPLSEVPRKKRKLEDPETSEIISVKKGRVAFEVVDEKTESKLEKLIHRIEPEPPPHVQNSEPPSRSKKRKGQGYVRWLDKWPWKPKKII
ncbi:hypothetical protein QL285_069741 [Trifolium repens]|nr:hypothetical protein QL285_069741 [Trifolium repens]